MSTIVLLTKVSIGFIKLNGNPSMEKFLDRSKAWVMYSSMNNVKFVMFRTVAVPEKRTKLKIYTILQSFTMTAVTRNSISE